MNPDSSPAIKLSPGVLPDREAIRVTAGRSIDSQPGAVWVVVGEPAAELATDRQGEPILRIPGADRWREVLERLIESLPERGRVILALASPCVQIPSVQAATWDLA